MAKDFTRSSNLQQPPPTPVVQAKPSENGAPPVQTQPPQNGATRHPTQTPPLKRSWQPQNSSPPPQQGDREAEIVEALKTPEFLQTIAQVLKDRKEAAIDAEEFVRHAVRQIQSRDLEAHDKLAMCTPASVQTAVKKLAVMGLSPNADQGEGWLLPRWNKYANSYCAIAVPGVRGMEKKLMETGKVANIESRAIYLQDHIKVRLGTENIIDHEVNFCPDPQRPNPIVGAYGIVTLKDRRREIAVKRLYQSPPKEPKQGQQQQQEEKEKASRGYMDEETNARYLAQRPAMKGALNKFFKEDRGLQALLEMEVESYESAINREAGNDTKIKVEPRDKSIAIPLAQVGIAPQPPETAQQQPGPDTRQKTEPSHPVDQMADKIRHQYEDQTQADVERGVRV
jgi:recombinational DNA repair protein RecT